MAPDCAASTISRRSRVARPATPSAWLIVEGGEVVGLCAITRPPVDGFVDIGYGIAPTRQGSSAATRAVARVVAWADGDSRVRRLTAEIAVDNVASQRVLERNGFLRCGERVDPEDGALLCWECITPRRISKYSKRRRRSATESGQVGGEVPRQQRKHAHRDGPLKPA